MYVISIMGMSLGIVLITASFDIASSYMAERVPRESRPEKIEKVPVFVPVDPKIWAAIARYREIKRQELGVFSIGQHPPQRDHGVHRRPRTSR